VRRKWTWPFANGCECNSSISSTDFVLLAPNWDKHINMLGHTLKNNDIQRNKWATFNGVMTSHLIIISR
jgi:hypothetical protein